MQRNPDGHDCAPQRAATNISFKEKCRRCVAGSTKRRGITSSWCSMTRAGSTRFRCALSLKQLWNWQRMSPGCALLKRNFEQASKHIARIKARLTPRWTLNSRSTPLAPANWHRNSIPSGKKDEPCFEVARHLYESVISAIETL